MIRLNEILQEVGGVVICLLICIHSGYASDHVVTAQEQTLSLLKVYLNTSDWQKRIAIRDASGENEILASRIYRAFDIIAMEKKVRDDVSIIEVARSELLRNTRMSLGILKPILFEEFSKEDQLRFADVTLPPVRDAQKNVVLQLMADVAMIETNRLARTLLGELTTHTNKHIARLSAMHLEQIERENWEAKKRQYEITKSCESLFWLTQRVLKKEMTRQEVELYFGKGVDTIDFEVKYSGVNERGQCSLLLHYVDGSLIGWKFQR